MKTDGTAESDLHSLRLLALGRGRRACGVNLDTDLLLPSPALPPGRTSGLLFLTVRMQARGLIAIACSTKGHAVSQTAYRFVSDAALGVFHESMCLDGLHVDCRKAIAAALGMAENLRRLTVSLRTAVAVTMACRSTVARLDMSVPASA